MGPPLSQGTLITLGAIITVTLAAAHQPHKNEINFNDEIPVQMQSTAEFMYERDFLLMHTEIDVGIITRYLSDASKNLDSSRMRHDRVPSFRESKEIYWWETQMHNATFKALKTRIFSIHTKLFESIEILEHSTGHRPKRALEFLGEAWYEISGSPGPTQLRNIKHSFDLAKKVINGLKKDANFTHTRLDHMQHFMENTNEALKGISLAVRSLNGKIDESSYYGGILAREMAKMYTFDTHLNEIERLVDIINGHAVGFESQGRISPRVFTTKDIRNTLKSEKIQKSGLSPLFLEQDIQKYFTIDHLAFNHLESGKVHFFARLPLVDRTDTYQVHPYFEHIESGLKYLLKHSNGVKYRLLHSKEVDEINKKGFHWFSTIRKIDFAVDSLNCSQIHCYKELMPMISEIEPNFFAFKNIGEHIMISCGGGSWKQALPSDGFMTVAPHCTLANEHLILEKSVNVAEIELSRPMQNITFHDLGQVKWHQSSDEIVKPLERAIAKQESNLETQKEIRDEQYAQFEKTELDFKKFKHFSIYAGAALSGIISIIMLVVISGICCICTLKKLINKYHAREN